jgi:transcriptional regulator GlxA family with amidase domain
MVRAWSDTPTYLLQRRIFRAVSAEGWDDTLAIEEAVIQLLERVIRCAYRGTGTPRTRVSASRQREVAHLVETLLSRDWRETVRLQDLAAEAGLSVYHLCRTFRRATGASIHQYRNRLRVRSCLEPVWDTATPLTDIALESGFYSHSHFTGAFRREFDRPPVAFR